MIEKLNSWLQRNELPEHISMDKDGIVRLNIDSPKAREAIEAFGNQVRRIRKPRRKCRWNKIKGEYEEVSLFKCKPELYYPEHAGTYYDA